MEGWDSRSVSDDEPENRFPRWVALTFASTEPAQDDQSSAQGTPPPLHALGRVTESLRSEVASSRSKFSQIYYLQRLGCFCLGNTARARRSRRRNTKSEQISRILSQRRKTQTSEHEDNSSFFFTLSELKLEYLGTCYAVFSNSSNWPGTVWCSRWTRQCLGADEAKKLKLLKEVSLPWNIVIFPHCWGVSLKSW